MKTYAFVPARSGSKGLGDKNIREIDGHPLMAYAIAFGHALNVDQVIVSTDSQQYAEIAHQYNGVCPYLRGPKASSDTAMEEDIFADLEENLPKYGIEMPDIWVRLKPTNPFRSVARVKEGLALMTGPDAPDSVRIVSRADCRICTTNDAGFLEPLLKGHWDPNRSVMRRSEFPETYSPFNLDLLFHKNLARWGSGYMGRRIHPIVDHSITALDINGPDDFDILRAMVEARPRPQVISDYLVTPVRAE